jgi:hypothetical protein
MKPYFAWLFEPSLSGEVLSTAIDAWQKKHLSSTARARMVLLAAGKLRKADEVLVTSPDGTVSKLSPGPSSLISKAVVEQFSIYFFPNPGLLWLSESGNKIRHQDDEIAKALGLDIDQSKILPDIILVNIGENGNEMRLIFIEVVASDGPMNQARKDALLEYVRKSEFPVDQCIFGTAFEDRADGAFKKALPTLAWGTFAWFRSEPERLMWLAEEPYYLT